MFVWMDLGRWLKEPTWEEEAGMRNETLDTSYAAHGRAA
jgi:hypothetical protein